MKKYLLSSVAFLAISSAALAADPIVFVEEVVVPAPVSIWEGAFIGVLGGYGWAQDGLDVNSYSNHDMTVERKRRGQGENQDYFREDLGEAMNRHEPVYLYDEDSSWASDSGDGWFGGGVIGYNFQSGNFVFGVEADISFSDIDVGSQSASTYASVAFTPEKREKNQCEKETTGFSDDSCAQPSRVAVKRPKPGEEGEPNGEREKPLKLEFPISGSTSSTTTADASVDWYGTARLKAGFALDNFLIYGTGGLAFGQVKLNGTVNNVHSFGNGAMSYQSSSFSDSSTQLGWTLGAGVDVALTPNFIIGAFYRYVDLGSVSGGNGQGDGVNFDAIGYHGGEDMKQESRRRKHGKRYSVNENGYGSGGASADANFHTVGVRAVYKFDTSSLFN